MRHRLTAATAAALFLLAGAAAAAGTTATATPAATATAEKAPVPVNIESNEMEVLDAEKKAIFRGNVDATRGDTNLKSDELTVLYSDVKQPDGTTKTDATDLDAKGNVKITTAKETITGDWAKYKPQTDQLVVGGKVKLVQGTTVITGEELHADTKTHKMEMKGGRVKGSFLPKNK